MDFETIHYEIKDAVASLILSRPARSNALNARMLEELNVAMDLAPFSDIDPCGYPGLPVTQTSAHGVRDDAPALGQALASRIAQLLESR